jgi:hypothetical protein
MNRAEIILKELQRRELQNNFYAFCVYMDPVFFSDDKPHLRIIAEAFQSVADGRINELAISLPPRAGKSYITSLFCAWMLGKHPDGSIMRNSYAAKLAEKFSKDIRDGIIQGAVGADLFIGNQPQSDPRCKPVLFGHMIEPYSCRWQNEYIWYDPIALTELENSRTQGRGRGLRLRSADVFQRPKILSRQTADHIIAAMDDQGYYYMNTLHGTAITDSAFDPWYVLAVMNSALIRCWYAWRFAETGRSFAQVKIANLKSLPVLLLESEQREKIALLARQVASARKQSQDYRFLLSEIDDILYSYSRLDKQTVQIMQEFTNKSSAPTARRRTRRETHVNTID